MAAELSEETLETILSSHQLPAVAPSPLLIDDFEGGWPMVAALRYSRRMRASAQVTSHAASASRPTKPTMTRAAVDSPPT
jgi:hypothetical protein